MKLDNEKLEKPKTTKFEKIIEENRHRHYIGKRKTSEEPLPHNLHYNPSPSKMMKMSIPHRSINENQIDILVDTKLPTITSEKAENLSLPPQNSSTPPDFELIHKLFHLSSRLAQQKNENLIQDDHILPHPKTKLKTHHSTPATTNMINPRDYFSIDEVLPPFGLSIRQVSTTKNKTRKESGPPLPKLRTQNISSGPDQIESGEHTSSKKRKRETKDIPLSRSF
jgi:hypothetical protein